MIAFLSRLARLLVVLLLVRMALRALAAWGRPSRGAPGGLTPGTELVKDRVCNTYLPRERALRAIVSGREEYFCSAACHDRARGIPGRNEAGSSPG